MPSINQELEKIPRQRAYSHDVKGLILYLPRTHLVVVPFTFHADGSWDCVVVKGNGTYPVGGHDILVSKREILTGIELSPIGFRPLI